MKSQIQTAMVSVGTSSVGLRGIASRVIAPDRTSKIFGTRFEEGLVKQAIGQSLLSCRNAMPSRVAVFASEPELDVISRGGLCGTLASAFRGSLELRELTQPALRDFILARQSSSEDAVMVILLGSEKRPVAWPLPDFEKLVTNPPQPSGHTNAKDRNLSFGCSGDWLRLDRKGSCSVIDSKAIESSWLASGSSTASAFEYSWGVWASLLPSQKTPQRRIVVDQVKLASRTAGQLVLSTAASDKIIQFLKPLENAPGESLVASFPTPEAGRWLFQAAGVHPEILRQVVFCEEFHGWGPAFSFLRFSADYPTGSRLLVMRDLVSVDLVVVR